MALTKRQKDVLIAQLGVVITMIEEERYDSAIWRIVDVAGILTLESSDSIGAKTFTGAGFKILKSKDAVKWI